MKKNIIFFLLTLLVLSCNNKNDTKPDESAIEKPSYGGTLTIASSSDFDYLNPVISDPYLDYVQDLIYPTFNDIIWDDQTGLKEIKPYFASSWSFSNDEKDLTYILKPTIFWEDGISISPEDVQYTFNLYANSIVASPKQVNLSFLIKDAANKTDIKKSITIKNDSTITFHFSRKNPMGLYHTNLKFIPKHYFTDITPKNLRNSDKNFQPLSAGPYRMEKWEENQYIIFSRNQKFSLKEKPYIDKIIFKIIPDRTTQLISLKNNEVDIMEGIYPDDVNSLKTNYPQINIVPFIGSYYDYISWSNIDNEYFKKTGKIKPHRLFGSKNIRKALTISIDRVEIIKSYLGEYGIICNTPVSPVFKWAYNSDIKPYEANRDEAIKLFNSEGWKDTDGDGILDKNGQKFKFTLYIDPLNKRREYAANIVQSYLRKVGIEASIEKIEWNVFNQKINEREIDAFISGLKIPTDLDFRNFWYSDLKLAKWNDPGFQNRRVDELIDLIGNCENTKESASYLKEFQSIIHEEQPCTFLYWYANIVGMNKRVRNFKSNIWDTYNRLWEWYLAPSSN